MRICHNACLVCGKLSSEALCPDCQKGLKRRNSSGCKICGRILLAEIDTCWPCRSAGLVLEKLSAPFFYRGLGKVLMQEYKFHHGWNLAGFWARAMSSFIPNTDWIIVPVPPRKVSLEQRGWDPVERIWKELKKIGYKGEKLLFRGEGKTQKGLNRKERMENLSEQLFLRTFDLHDKIILIDDTFTTGSTLNACAEILGKERLLRIHGLCATGS